MPSAWSANVDKLLPVVVGAIVGVVPVMTSTCFETRAQAARDLRAQQLTVVKDFSAACARRVQVAKRVVDLGDVTSAGPWNESVQNRLIDQWLATNQEMAESQVALRSQVDLTNALFHTTLAIPLDTMSEPPVRLSHLSAVGDLPRDRLRASIPNFARQCQSSS